MTTRRITNCSIADDEDVLRIVCAEISRLCYKAKGLDPEELWQDKENACRVTIVGALIILAISGFIFVRLSAFRPWICFTAVMCVAGLTYLAIRQIQYLVNWHIGATGEEIALVRKWSRIRRRVRKCDVFKRLVSEFLSNPNVSITACTSWTATLRTFEEIRRRS